MKAVLAPILAYAACLLLCLTVLHSRRPDVTSASPKSIRTILIPDVSTPKSQPGMRGRRRAAPSRGVEAGDTPRSCVSLLPGIGPDDSAQGSTPPTLRGAATPLIVELIGREYTIRVVSGPAEPLYSILSKSGTVLAPPMTLDEMRAFNPELHKHLNGALALKWAGM